MADIVNEVQTIKAEVLAYRDAVVAKVADLEAQLAKGAVSPEVQAAVDDLKAAVDSLTPPA